VTACCISPLSVPDSSSGTRRLLSLKTPSTSTFLSPESGARQAPASLIPPTHYFAKPVHHLLRRNRQVSPNFDAFCAHDLSALLTTQATFRHPATLQGDSCWAITPITDTNRGCGCNSGGWMGTGVYYGGWPEGSCNVCSCQGGEFVRRNSANLLRQYTLG